MTKRRLGLRSTGGPEGPQMRSWVRSHLTYANVMSTLALFLVLGGGTAYAATGGNFILGKPNTAKNTTGLSSGVATGPTLAVTNSGGMPAASFTSGSGAAPFTVSSTAKVANLNASLLNGIPSSGFMRTAIPVSVSGSAPGDVFDVTNTGSGYAISGSTPNTASAAAAVHGSSGQGRGVEGLSGSFQGVYGHSNSNAGVVGESGSFDGVFGVAHGAQTAGVSGHNDHGGFGVWGQGGSVSNGTAAIHGQSGAGNAVEGISQSSVASGVYGENDSTGYGVAGRSASGTGVLADSSSGWALNASGNATQSRAGGGFVKAMAFIDPFASDPIVRCFNSQLPASQATSGDCGITYTRNQTGLYTLDFGFQVSDRFALTTPKFAGDTVDAYAVSATALGVGVANRDGNLDHAFFIFVF